MSRGIRLDRFTSPDEFATGKCDGVDVTASGLVLADGMASGTWTSPMIEPSFGIASLVPSFTAATPGSSWLELHARLRVTDGETTAWYALGRWSSTGMRTSIASQRDDHAYVDTDVLLAEVSADAWQLRVTLHRAAADDAAAAEPITEPSPVVRSLSAVAAEPKSPAEPSVVGNLAGIVLDVPRFSQRLHRGRYPQWGGGGASWCSPASVSMVTEYWGVGPTDLSWVDPGPDPRVVHAARGTYDEAYGACGNWPFNTAYAGTFGLDAYVTRLNSLAEAEPYIESGIPLVVSAGYRAGQVPGVDYDTNGHLLVLVGFTEAGDPVVNDPAADSNEAVRKTFGRREFEQAWQSTSGGVVYVIRPHGAGA